MAPEGRLKVTLRVTLLMATCWFDWIFVTKSTRCIDSRSIKIIQKNSAEMTVTFEKQNSSKQFNRFDF